MLAMLPIVYLLVRVQHTVTPEGILSRGLFRSRQCSWEDIESAMWKPSLKILVLRSSMGRHRFFLEMNNLSSLANAILAGAVTMPDETRLELTRWAGGQIPNPLFASDSGQQQG